MAPATPTGLHVDETTETSIEWQWNAVEGALAYAVQVSMDEMFDDMDMIDHTTENHYTVSELEPDTSVYLRVAAAAGSLEAPLLSAWSTHVTGMSNQPPPMVVPPPDPVSAMFMIPDDAKKMYPMIPDESDDKEEAMASVNSEMMVTSNTTAVVVPMNFMEDAMPSPVKLHEGDNMPFQYVNWEAMQSQVVDTGVTFKIMRVTLGASQEMEPTGDVAYVTCGPFACVEGMDAPDIGIADSAACEGWDPSLELMPGVIDPLGTDDADADGTADDAIAGGFDLGWVYTANTTFSVKHDFGAFDSSGGDVGKGTDSALPAGRSPSAGTTARRDILDGGRTVIDVDGCTSENAGFDLYGDSVGDMDQPGNCFRLSADSRFLSQYSVVLSPKDAGVSWGEIAWDAFKDLKCEAKTFVADEQIDVCELLTAEVDEISGRMSVVPVVGGVTGDGANGVVAGRLAGFDLVLPISQTRWTALNYYDTTTSSRTDTDDLYDRTDIGTTGENAAGRADDINRAGRVNGYTDPATGEDSHRVWIEIHDEDGDPMYGDLGKVDASATTELANRGNAADRTAAPGPDTRTADTPTGYGGDDRAENYFDQGNDAIGCSDEDGGEKSGTTNQGTGTAARALSNGNGTLCDAEDVEIPTSVTFTDGMGFNCAVPRSYTLTCQWDSSGGRKAGTIGATRAQTLTQADADDFVSCTVS
ncbi:MAG: fibronectin type III domain-containing protein [bacterium]|nr:fibronectin type III domain-containing protein [bacterium]